MIDVKELRVGNIVFLKSKNKYYEITSGYEIDNGTESDDFEPVELNEDILIKCFFVKQSIEGYYYLTLRMYSSELYIYHNVMSNLILMSEDDVYICNTGIKYLHDLQNLYYALTKKELEVSL